MFEKAMLFQEWFESLAGDVIGWIVCRDGIESE
jgi:hypothetical protein